MGGRKAVYDKNPLYGLVAFREVSCFGDFVAKNVLPPKLQSTKFH
jgi:hypothetical protein